MDATYSYQGFKGLNKYKPHYKVPGYEVIIAKILKMGRNWFYESHFYFTDVVGVDELTAAQSWGQ
jgi:hypothetical protein